MTQLEEMLFLSWLNGEHDYQRPTPLGDGRYVAMVRLLFHWSLIVGRIGDRDCYDDRFCYADREAASDAIDEWASRKFADEPAGWTRHPLSGRRRAGGDASVEQVRA